MSDAEVWCTWTPHACLGNVEMFSRIEPPSKSSSVIAVTRICMARHGHGHSEATNKIRDSSGHDLKRHEKINSLIRGNLAVTEPGCKTILCSNVIVYGIDLRYIRSIPSEQFCLSYAAGLQYDEFKGGERHI